MIIVITVDVEEDSLIDKKHKMGITNRAYEQLVDSLISLGYSVQNVEKE